MRLNLSCLPCLSYVSLILAVSQFFYVTCAEADNNLNNIQSQRLAEEANALINPSPMQTVSATTPVSNLAPASVIPKPAVKPTPTSSAPATQETGVMGYYDALVSCQKGIFNFDNPAYLGTNKKVVITGSIQGLQGGYCVVNIFFSNQPSTTINCLFSNQDRLVLKDKKARDDFNNAYAQGELNSGKKTAYDKIVANACQME